MEPRLFDAHCHLDLMAYPNAVADETAAIGLGVFDCGVDPRDFAATKKRASRQVFYGIISVCEPRHWRYASGTHSSRNWLRFSIILPQMGEYKTSRVEKRRER